MQMIAIRHRASRAFAIAENEKAASPASKQRRFDFLIVIQPNCYRP